MIEANQKAHGNPPPRSGGGARGLGLVSNETTVPRQSIILDNKAQRLRRMKCVVGHSARLLHFSAHGERAARRWNLKLVTLTYRPGVRWQREHVSYFVRRLRKWCEQSGVRCRFVWVAELQKRGVIHYHVVLWLPRGLFFTAPDRCGWWPHGMSNVKSVRSSAVGYLLKYASKCESKDVGRFPKGARLYGAGGLSSEDRRHVRYWRAPFWVRDALTGLADIRKVVGGYVDAVTGEFLRSPWRVVCRHGVWCAEIGDWS